MAKKQNSGKVTIANLIAMVGIVLLTVFTYIGYSFKSGGSIGISVGVAVGIAAAAALLLWFMIKAKSAENYLDKWKIAEIVALATYVVFAIVSSIYGGSLYFFVINEQRDHVKTLANNDLNKIDKLFEEYETFENEALEKYHNGITNATTRNAHKTDTLAHYLTNNSINRDNISAKEEYQRSKVLGDDFILYNDSKNAMKADIINSIDSWSIMRVPALANQISDYAAEAEIYLSELSHTAELPLITLNDAQKYDLGENQVRDFAIDGGVENLEFQRGITEASGVSFLGIVVVLFIHLLILFNYIVTYRTKTIAVGKHTEEDGGIHLS